MLALNQYYYFHGCLLSSIMHIPLTFGEIVSFQLDFVLELVKNHKPWQGNKIILKCNESFDECCDWNLLAKTEFHHIHNPDLEK